MESDERLELFSAAALNGILATGNYDCSGHEQTVLLCKAARNIALCMVASDSIHDNDNDVLDKCRAATLNGLLAGGNFDCFDYDDCKTVCLAARELAHELLYFDISGAG